MRWFWVACSAGTHSRMWCYPICSASPSEVGYLGSAVPYLEICCTISSVTCCLLVSEIPKGPILLVRCFWDHEIRRETFSAVVLPVALYPEVNHGNPPLFKAVAVWVLFYIEPLFSIYPSLICFFLLHILYFSLNCFNSTWLLLWWNIFFYRNQLRFKTRDDMLLKAQAAGQMQLPFRIKRRKIHSWHLNVCVPFLVRLLWDDFFVYVTTLTKFSFVSSM